VKPKALLSIHDVMPATLPAVSRCLALLRQHGIDRTSLLVVPGADWGEDGRRTLREFADAGHEFVAHGWHHHTRPRGPYHRAHATLLSRNVAEHLALDQQGIIELIHRSRYWFAEQQLPVPAAYIPPAWALGRLRGRALARQPFTVLETLRGVHMREDDDSYRFMALPLVGFEADSPLREVLLGHWNRLQLRRARRLGVPLRIAIHPQDPELRLGHQLRAVLGLGWTPVPYGALAAAPDRPPLCA
jgi:predicted deacetylase